MIPEDVSVMADMLLRYCGLSPQESQKTAFMIIANLPSEGYELVPVDDGEEIPF